MNKVYIVGMGTGDESLLTLKAFKIIEESDVIIGDFVWIGAKVIILPGTVIGEGVKKHLR